ncbi:STAS domain-containing protein [Thiohalospira halophila DSM 15071]|uniref:STAS domain-containing protein n=1 Tax=Thiohalospira halophila DSM 15071 TaxID=1123397 RepID=A0A1I1SGL5_9GAMM|nr:SulP family inorganic anion transporter [Thiohalospira halophila]SFD42140.1 STAS domain-containing protein [Thiohalospira halophila DSM 15071]
MKQVLENLFPFLRWFPMSQQSLRSDLIAGITVALVIVPQSMAYAQLAGLPVVYGLYASLVPVIIASLWGSCSQLHTGPVAMLSLMSAAALIPFASPGSDRFIELSIMLALMVGVLRLLLGLFRLGVIVNFLSSPVIVGFTNAAALIIGLSQFSKVLGVPFPRTDFYLGDLWNVVTQVSEAHWPTVLIALGAWAVMHFGRKLAPSFPSILAAVVLATGVSAAIGFERNTTVSLDQVADPAFTGMARDYASASDSVERLTERLSELNEAIRAAEEEAEGQPSSEGAAAKAEREELDARLARAKAQRNELTIDLHAHTLTREEGRFVAAEEGDWRFNRMAGEGRVQLAAGGAVVGSIPEGLPSFNVPVIDQTLMWELLPAALVMALIGFMEATSISKAIAAQTGERIDTSKELVGQGLGNIVGSFFGSYTVSGSFSRSAVAARTGAKTGLFAIISAVGVMVVLLYLTPYLYHLPQAVLAVIVMTAVFGLIRVQPLVQAWKVERPAAVIGIITFLATLYLAPDLANGILLGVILTILAYLIQTMRPRAEIVARRPDGGLGGIEAHGLEPMSEDYVPVRFDGSLSFINVAYFEDIILEARSRFPKARTILVIGSGINSMDSSGEEKVRELVDRLQKQGVTLAFSSLKSQVRRVFENGDLVERIGVDNIYADKETALRALQEEERQLGDASPA